MRLPWRLRCWKTVELLTVSSHLDGGVLTFTVNTAHETIELQSTRGADGNTIQFDLGNGPVTQSGVMAIHLVGTAGDTLAFVGNSIADDLTITADGAVDFSGNLTESSDLHVTADDVSVTGSIVGGHVNLSAVNSLAVAGRIISSGGSVSLTSGANGTTTLTGDVDVSTVVGSAQTGGSIAITGGDVILDGAQLDAAGDVGGGTVLVGGGPHGVGTAVTAGHTFVGDGSRIDASALSAGDGGTVVVWSSENTRLDGATIDADAGPLGGRGGSIETSGKNGLGVVASTVTARGSDGRSGSWLMDPQNVTVENAAGIIPSGSNPLFFIPAVPDAIVDVTDVETALDLGTSVTINTGVTGTQNGDITVVDPITSTGTGGPTLQLNAAHNVNINAAISGTVLLPLNVAITAGNNVQITASINTFGGTFTSSGVDFDNTAAGTIMAGAGAITITHSGTTTIGGAVSNSALVHVSGGTASVASTINAGSLQMDDAVTFSGGSVTTTVDQTYTAAITLGAATTLTGANLTVAGVTGGGFDFTLSGTGLTTLGGAVSGVHTLTSNNGGTTTVNSTISASAVSMVDAATLDGGSVTTTGDQTYSNTITLGAATVLTGVNLTLPAVTGGGFDLTLSGAGLTTLNGAIASVNTLTSNNGGTTVVNNTIGAAKLNMVDPVTFNVGSVTTTGDQTYSGTITLGATTTLTGANLTLAGVTGAGFNLTLGGTSLTTLGGAVSGVNTLTSNNGGTTTVDNTISAATLDMVDAATLQGGNITTSGDQTYSNTSTLAAATALSGANLSLAGVTGAGFDLALHGSLLTTLGGPISGVGMLSSDNGGTTTIGGTIAQ